MFFIGPFEPRSLIFANVEQKAEETPIRQATLSDKVLFTGIVGIAVLVDVTQSQFQRVDLEISRYRIHMRFAGASGGLISVPRLEI